jgi:hypothetical protein
VIKQILEHPEFWAVVGLSWGIASDILGASKTVKQNGVSQLIVALITDMINAKQTNRNRR